jgi:hypothetical protein
MKETLRLSIEKPEVSREIDNKVKEANAGQLYLAGKEG